MALPVVGHLDRRIVPAPRPRGGSTARTRARTQQREGPGHLVHTLSTAVGLDQMMTMGSDRMVASMHTAWEQDEAPALGVAPRPGVCSPGGHMECRLSPARKGLWSLQGERQARQQGGQVGWAGLPGGQRIRRAGHVRGSALCGMDGTGICGTAGLEQTGGLRAGLRRALVRAVLDWVGADT